MYENIKMDREFEIQNYFDIEMITYVVDFLTTVICWMKALDATILVEIGGAL